MTYFIHPGDIWKTEEFTAATMDEAIEQAQARWPGAHLTIEGTKA